MSTELIQFLQDNGAYIDVIVPVGCAHDGTEAAGFLRDWIEDAAAEEINEAFGTRVVEPEDKDDDDDEYQIQLEDILQRIVLKRLDGFLVWLQIPVRTYHQGGGMFRSGLSHVREHVLYTPNLSAPEFIERVKQAVNESIAADKARAGAAPADR